MKKPLSVALGAYLLIPNTLNIMARKLSLILLVLLLFPGVASCETVTASTVPWSGYWWPLNKGGLINGSDYFQHPAPLEKYDLLVRNYYPSTLTNWYKSSYYDSSAPSWYGHCLDWSKAAIQESYAILPSSEGNIHFRVGDKKGLLTIAHLNDLYEVSHSTASTFHYWLLHYIKDLSTPFIADLDATSEKWYYPIYKYDMHSSITGNTESVTVTIDYASDDVHPDFMGTKTSTTTYTYDLTLSDNGAILSGQWTGDTITDHPDRLFFPVLQRTNASGFDYEFVREIAQNSDDALESGEQLAALSPGTYNLVLLDQDNYALNATTNESFTIQIEKLEGSQTPLKVALENGNGNSSEKTIETTEPAEYHFSNTILPPYTLHIDQADYDAPNLYTLTVWQRKGFTQHIPYLPRNGNWLGFSLTNDSPTAVDNVTVTTNDADGVPIQTVFGPLSLAPHQKKVFLFEQLPYRAHELGKSRGLVLQADSEVSYVSIVGTMEATMAHQVHGSVHNSHIVLGHTIDGSTPTNKLIGALFNSTLEQNPIMVGTYSREGVLLDQFEMTLEEQETVLIQPGTKPFSDLADGGWIDVSSQIDEELGGYLYHQTEQSADGMYGLQVNTEKKLIPHIPEPGYWETTLTIINPTAKENQIQVHATKDGTATTRDLFVTLAPYEKRLINVGEEFTPVAVGQLNNSLTAVFGDHNFSGYFSYKNRKTGEIASFPLLSSSHLQNKLTIPHYPEKSQMWTGIILANPLSTVQPVIISAYNEQGELIHSGEVELTINANEYTPLSVGSLWPTATENIAYVSCKTTDPNGSIGGLYLYGGKGNNPSLSGALM